MTPLPPLPLDGQYTRPGNPRGAAVPFWHAPAGYCRWCGYDLEQRLRDGRPNPKARWHPGCAAMYNSYQPAAQRARLWARELGECAGCGRYCPRRMTLRDIDVPAFKAEGLSPVLAFYRTWAVDHRTPLADGGSNEDTNLQLLCDPCHAAKTRREATARAARRRQVAAV